MSKGKMNISGARRAAHLLSQTQQWMPRLPEYTHSTFLKPKSSRSPRSMIWQVVHVVKWSDRCKMQREPCAAHYKQRTAQTFTATAMRGQHLLQMWPSLPQVRTSS